MSTCSGCRYSDRGGRGGYAPLWPGGHTSSCASSRALTSGFKTASGISTRDTVILTTAPGRILDIGHQGTLRDQEHRAAQKQSAAQALPNFPVTGILATRAFGAIENCTTTSRRQQSSMSVLKTTLPACLLLAYNCGGWVGGAEAADQTIGFSYTRGYRCVGAYSIASIAVPYGCYSCATDPVWKDRLLTAIRGCTASVAPETFDTSPYSFTTCSE